MHFYPCLSLKLLISSGLTLPARQVPTKPLYHSPFSTGKERENMTKALRIKIRTGKSES